MVTTNTSTNTRHDIPSMGRFKWAIIRTNAVKNSTNRHRWKISQICGFQILFRGSFGNILKWCHLASARLSLWNVCLWRNFSGKIICLRLKWTRSSSSRWKSNINQTKEFILFLKINSEVFLSSQSKICTIKTSVSISSSRWRFFILESSMPDFTDSL